MKRPREAKRPGAVSKKTSTRGVRRHPVTRIRPFQASSAKSFLTRESLPPAKSPARHRKLSFLGNDAAHGVGRLVDLGLGVVIVRRQPDGRLDPLRVEVVDPELPER